MNDELDKVRYHANRGLSFLPRIGLADELPKTVMLEVAIVAARNLRKAVSCLDDVITQLKEEIYETESGQ